MKQDKLESFIRNNRMAFDTDEAPAGDWDRIIPNNKPAAKPLWQSQWFRAAAIFILGALSYAFISKITDTEKVYQLSMAPDINRIDLAPLEVELTVKDSVFMNPMPVQQTNTNTKAPYSAAEIELSELNAFYSAQINRKRAELNIFAASRPGLKPRLDSEFAQMDSLTALIERDLKDNLDNREVIEALIQNYRMRIEILDNMLQQLKEEEQNELNFQENEN